MRVFVATAGAEPHHHAQREHFRSLAALDETGEHVLADDASDADALLFVDLQQHPHDTFLHVLRRHPLVRRHPGAVFVYDERDFPFVSFPGIYVGATPQLARRHPVVGGPYPALPAGVHTDKCAPELLFSFCGARTHPVRSAVLNLRHDLGHVSDTTAMSFPSWLDPGVDEDQRAARREYTTTIARSKFVLCPRGHSPSSFRLYETLAAGRVPVVISDDWLPPPRIDWSACLVRVRERDVAHIPSLLERLEPRWPQMAAGSGRTYAEHFSPERLWHHYASSLAALRGATRRRPWWAQREVVRVGVRRMRSVVSRS